MKIQKMEMALLNAEEGQADCFWHDQNESLRYLLVLQGVAQMNQPSDLTAVISQKSGLVSDFSLAYRFLATQQPEMLPGETGPVAVLLIL